MNKGFFFDSPSIVKNQKSYSPNFTCETCGLFRTCKSPKMRPTGSGERGILIVAEAPGREEDEEWERLGYPEPTQLIGEAGRLLRWKLEPYGLDLDRDFRKMNAVNCRPPRNREPTRKELKSCKHFILEEIESGKPKFIWLMGKKAVESFYMDRFDHLSVGLWRGRCIPDRDTGAWVLPMYHSSFLLHSKGDKNVESLFDMDLEFAVSCLGKESPRFEDEGQYVKRLSDLEDILGLLDRIKRDRIRFSFDYETSGLKPFKPGHHIRVMSIALGAEEAYSFEVPKSKRFGGKWRRVLTDPGIDKVAQNLKFEDRWSRKIYGAVPQGWIHDTMVAGHILDSRHNSTNLKFMVYVRWGAEGFKDDTETYLKSSEEFNRIDEAPLEDLCDRCGLDSLFTYRLYEEQMKDFGLSSNRGMYGAYQFFHEGLLAFCDMESEGIPVDEAYYERERRRLTAEINFLEGKLLEGKEAKLFEEKTGGKLGLGSSKDLRFLMFNLLNQESLKKTASGNDSVDEEALEKMKIPFVKDLLRLRKLLKIRDTYLAQFQREVVDGKIYPFWDLHIPESFRSSCSRPNFQNIPARDEEAKKSTRSGVVPSPGNKLVSGDYSGIEVAEAACITKDPVLVKYVSTPGTDMHRDQAMEIFILTAKQVIKGLRFYAKNGFTFPEFYGSYYKNCALFIWEVCKSMLITEGLTVRRHLRNQGILNYEDFEDHMKEVERRFWDKYSGFAEWKEKAIVEYRRKGYVDMPFGFRRIGLLYPKEIVNTPIQGTAFHCLLWSLIRLNEERKQEGWKSKLIMQIHDEMIWDMVPEESEHIKERIVQVSTVEIRKENDWIIVPLEVDFEEGGINESWYNVKGGK